MNNHISANHESPNSQGLPPHSERTSAACAASPASQTPSPQSSKKKYTPAQYALLSAFVYPGAGQLARKQKHKGGIIIAVFTVFLVWWLIWLAMGVFNLYGDILSVSSSAAAVELGVNYLKLSLIPGLITAIIFVYAIYDAYKG